MSAAPAAPAEAAPAGGGKKKLIIIIAAVLVLAIGGGVAALMMAKQKAAKAAAEAEAGEEAPAAHGGGGHAAAAKDPHSLPVFVPLDPFTVNLADRDADRYAQISVTLEVADAHVGDTLKAYMPAIRNNVLMVLARKSSSDLVEVDGKEKLAKEIQRATLAAMGEEMEDDDEAPADAHGKAAEKPAEGKKKKKKRAEPSYSVKKVHFANFIIQ